MTTDITRVIFHVGYVIGKLHLYTAEEYDAVADRPDLAPEYRRWTRLLAQLSRDLDKPPNEPVPGNG